MQHIIDSIEAENNEVEEPNNDIEWDPAAEADTM